MGGKKDIIKPFRLTQQGADRLKKQAKERGMKESEYIRLLLSQKPNDYPEIRILLKELINEVNAVGNNINQITRNYNSKLYRMEDRELLCAYMKKLNLTVREMVDKIGSL
ncbi:MAG: MobC family plasmid mobilization relaxosome protein [Lachnospiraceae bacterium]|nr:MobC family plasmid mobilization relaxosome protein [Lachnospiraceae bacterium]